MRRPKNDIYFSKIIENSEHRLSSRCLKQQIRDTTTRSPITFSPPTFSLSHILTAMTYPEVGATQWPHPVPSYDNDLNTIALGQGPAAWEAAKLAIRQWKMFPEGWTHIAPATPAIATGAELSMHARVLGIWWANGCRIVYIVDEPTRFGFAYGTLSTHVERGEELFLVERRADDSVHYVLKAFSKPRHILARLGYPLVRFFQRKFARESKESMRAFVAEHL
jgi:uncharacterized protein (UPF0548 family)